MGSVARSEQLPEQPEIPELPALREQFPVLAERAYLNAGTDGPLPAVAVDAALEQLRREAREGRTHEHFERRHALEDSLRNTLRLPARLRERGAGAHDVHERRHLARGLRIGARPRR